MCMCVTLLSVQVVVPKASTSIEALELIDKYVESCTYMYNVMYIYMYMYMYVYTCTCTVLIYMYMHSINFSI